MVLAHVAVCNAVNFFGNTIIRSKAQFILFVRTAVLRKLFDIRFSYKHCNFSWSCLLVKMAFKTVTRSIVGRGPMGGDRPLVTGFY